MSLKGVVGLFTANQSEDGEDVHIYLDEDGRSVETPIPTFCMLRQQSEKESEWSQADYVAPKGYKYHLGMFAVSCFGCDALVKKCEADNDNYSNIMAQALADRFVEAFAEYLHREIRTNSWGYAPDKKLDETDLKKIKYYGIRPAPGYPSQPDNNEKKIMWEAINAKEVAGIKLIESLNNRHT